VIISLLIETHIDNCIIVIVHVEADSFTVSFISLSFNSRMTRSSILNLRSSRWSFWFQM